MDNAHLHTNMTHQEFDEFELSKYGYVQDRISQPQESGKSMGFGSAREAMIAPVPSDPQESGAWERDWETICGQDTNWITPANHIKIKHFITNLLAKEKAAAREEMKPCEHLTANQALTDFAKGLKEEIEGIRINPERKDLEGIAAIHRTFWVETLKPKVLALLDSHLKKSQEPNKK